ncbi:MAG: 50S ribosomal protein L29 [Chlamydiae bacterium]|nr:50S ribosomal protein L29 [Chlamydiota bacterium]
MNVKDLREENDEQLGLSVETLRKEIFELRSQVMDSKTQKTHLIKQKRKDVARILTIQREKQLEKSDDR